MTKILVRPTKASAEQLVHPMDGPFRADDDGNLTASWSYDTFTCRRLSDGSVERAPVAAEVKPRPASNPVVSEQTAAAPRVDAAAKTNAGL